MRSSVEITQNTRRWQTGLGVTGNQQGKMLRSQILEHLQTRQSSENLQIDCIPVPRSRCRCWKGSNASSQQPTSKEIWNLLECKFCTFLKATLGISTDIEHWTKVFQASMRPIKSARILNSCQISCSLSIILLQSGHQLRAGNAKQLALEDTVWSRHKQMIFACSVLHLRAYKKCKHFVALCCPPCRKPLTPTQTPIETSRNWTNGQTAEAKEKWEKWVAMSADKMTPSAETWAHA